MRHETPRHSTSLTKWQQRVGAEKLVMLLEETVSIAVSDKHITKNELAQVNVDTTVHDMNITYPTDSKRYLKAIQKLAGAARNRGPNLCEGNPCDSHTLAQAIATTEQITRVSVTDA